jgi:hypothetical protein
VAQEVQPKNKQVQLDLTQYFLLSLQLVVVVVVQTQITEMVLLAEAVAVVLVGSVELLELVELEPPIKDLLEQTELVTMIIAEVVAAVVLVPLVLMV